MVALVVALDLGGSILGWCDWSALLNVSGALDGCQDASAVGCDISTLSGTWSTLGKALSALHRIVCLVLY
jgi:hypothetical protein